MRTGKGKSNGTFGELVQGVLNERPFLITLPTPTFWSKATFVENNQSRTIETNLNKHTKALTACKKLIERFNLNCGGYLKITSNIPVGKGMASSSADIVATIRAVADCFSLSITDTVLSEIAGEIEPTDGVMYEDAVAYNYIQSQMIERLGPLPPYQLIGIDFGGTIDTVTFNQRPKHYTEAEKAEFVKAYQLVRKGISTQNLALICRASTISARINQRILPKPFFNNLEKLASKYDGGIVTAHSGTVAGILLKLDLNNLEKELIVDELAQIVKSSTFYYIENNKIGIRDKVFSTY